MDEIALEAKERLAKCVTAFKNELVTLRTGRASPAMLDRIECDYYGDKIAINAISSISTPEPRQLLIKPYDKGDVKAIVAAINAANIGVNPVNEGDSIRITVAPLTEDTRRDLVKKAKAMMEECKVAARNVRREYVDFVKDADDMTDDYKERVQDDIQKVVDETMKEIEETLAQKEKEIMTV